jgi:hypothetical protein
MAIFQDNTHSFADVLTDELNAIANARQLKGLPIENIPPETTDASAAELSNPAPPSSQKPGIWQSLIGAIFGEKRETRQKPPYADALKQNLIGLALSGGGIRSATLSLGLLQGLASRGLLNHIDYLSTVSGGGYIGTWLISWILRSKKTSIDAKGALEQVEHTLKTNAEGTETAPCEPIHNLRRYSNYLTPNSSFLSADTWTIATIWGRNTVLNMAIIICVASVLMLLPRLVVRLLASRPDSSVLLGTEFYIGALFLAGAVIAIGYNLSKLFQTEKNSGNPPGNSGKSTGAGQSAVQWFVVVPFLAASIVLVECLRISTVYRTEWFFIPTVVFMVLYAALAIIGGFPKCFCDRNCKRLPKWLLIPAGLALVLIASVISAAITACALYGLYCLFPQSGSPWRATAVVCIGPPLVLMILALGLVSLVGLMGHDLPDSSREWLGRLRAWTLIYSTGWLLITAISLYGPFTLYWAGSKVSLSFGALWGALSAAGLLAGKSPKTSGQSTNTSVDYKSTALRITARVAPFVFMLGFATFIGLGIHELVSSAPADIPAVKEPTTIKIAASPEPITITVGQKTTPITHFAVHRAHYSQDLNSAQARIFDPLNSLGSLFIFTALGGLLLSWRVDINEFSMHHFYKNRLVRCYLGASHTDGTPNAFTRLDTNDDLPLAGFTEDAYCGPYPIINGALNLAGGSALAWQERKAASFVFTPQFCGYDKPQLDHETRNPEPESRRHSRNAYVRTKAFFYEQGIKIGTAMGISGAAVNPNCGFHTSSAVAFLMTLFNVRLGWWLGNPAYFGKEKNPGPALGITYLITELFGLANANRGYINVSDGGHFENLGIYELVKRRCRYIIACDGEQDGDMKFEGLANAIRKCRTDLNVDIAIDVEQLRRTDGLSRTHCIVGKIKYLQENETGFLLYLKASLTGNEDTDILQYHTTHPEFPHQSTGDQWFDEPQFESYRKLGLHMTDSVFSAISATKTRTHLLAGPFMTVADYSDAKYRLFHKLRDALYPPSETIQKYFSKHASDYTKLIQDVAKGNDFKYLDDVIFGTGTKTADDIAHQRRYFSISYLQLMENIYLDLNLDDPIQREHPHNAGWMKLFTQWANSEAFKDAWEMARNTYGKPFQTFYDSLTGTSTRRG